MVTSKRTRNESGRRAKKVRGSAGIAKRKTVPARPSKLVMKTAPPPVIRRVPAESQLIGPQTDRVFSIEVDAISGETTIGDLIVAFPRTRDVLLKRGLRFDVEEAGYLYMTLNVFSAIHGFEPANLIRELQGSLKEAPPQPPLQTLRQVANAPTV